MTTTTASTMLTTTTASTSSMTSTVISFSQVKCYVVDDMFTALKVDTDGDEYVFERARWTCEGGGEGEVVGGGEGEVAGGGEVVGEGVKVEVEVKL